MVKVRHYYISFGMKLIVLILLSSACRARLLLANSHSGWRWMGSVSGNFIILGFLKLISPGDRSIISQAQTNIRKCTNEFEDSLDTHHNPRIKGRSSSLRHPSFKLPFSAHSRSSKPKDISLEGLIQSGNFNLKVVGLQKYFNLRPSKSGLSTLDLQLKADATKDEIMVAIKDAGVFLMILPMFSLHV
jgi:hypothetical protein